MNKKAALTHFFMLTVLSLSMNAGFAETPTKYWIKVTPTVIDSLHVDVDLQTNIEKGMLSLNIELMNQKPEDTYFGTDSVKVQINNGKAKISIDGTKNTSPLGTPLPTGNYKVVVSFYPGWAENKLTATQNGITNDIEGSSIIKFGTAGFPVSSAKKMSENQTWVMDNVDSNSPWDASWWINRFGPWQEVEYKGNMNSKVMKMYYFSSINMTLMVNIIKKEIATWRLGLENH